MPASLACAPADSRLPQKMYVSCYGVLTDLWSGRGSESEGGSEGGSGSESDVRVVSKTRAAQWSWMVGVEGMGRVVDLVDTLEVAAGEGVGGSVGLGL